MRNYLYLRKRFGRMPDWVRYKRGRTEEDPNGSRSTSVEHCVEHQER
jgi:hypothetical protein